jgi:AAT family amino acid transporter
VSEDGPAADPTGMRELVRGLSHRQIQLIAIGGAVGVGLFLGSANAIEDAGPAVLLCYALAGGIVFMMLRALGELAMYRPVTGSFASHAADLIGPWAGFTTGWIYWAMWMTTVMAEVTAIGLYAQYFFPGLQQWIPALIAVVLLLAANLASVRMFGEVEFWFALIKVVAILAFIASGIAILCFGIGDLPQAGVSNLWDQGGFAPKGVLGPLIALQIVTYAFLGVEMIGVAAGETRDPRRELPLAINRGAWRILLFYIGAIAVVVMLVPWDQIGAGQSPFVVAWKSIGIPAAAGILNAVVLTSALSSSNTGIFTSARMLYTLAGRGEAPRRLRNLSRRHVPSRALAVCAVALAVAVILNAAVPEQAFTYITSAATVAVLWVWAMIVIVHLRFRARVRRGGAPRPGLPSPGLALDQPGRARLRRAGRRPARGHSGPADRPDRGRRDGAPAGRRLVAAAPDGRRLRFPPCDPEQPLGIYIGTGRSVGYGQGEQERKGNHGTDQEGSAPESGDGGRLPGSGRRRWRGLVRRHQAAEEQRPLEADQGPVGADQGSEQDPYCAERGQARRHKGLRVPEGLRCGGDQGLDRRRPARYGGLQLALPDRDRLQLRRRRGADPPGLRPRG